MLFKLFWHDEHHDDDGGLMGQRHVNHHSSIFKLREAFFTCCSTPSLLLEE